MYEGMVRGTRAEAGTKEVARKSQASICKNCGIPLPNRHVLGRPSHVVEKRELKKGKCHSLANENIISTV
jgi:hypothetical protein